MDHIGIDLGSRDSQVCVRNSAGEIIEEVRRSTALPALERHGHISLDSTVGEHLLQ